MNCKKCNTELSEGVDACQACKDGQQGGDTQYLSISLKRLIIASIVSFGLYQIYWFYKNWKAVKQTEGTDVWPFWRAVFAIFFCYGIFRRVLANAKADGYLTGSSAAVLAAAYIAAMLIGNDVSYLIVLASIIPLMAVQEAINFSAQKHGHGLRERLSRAEIIVIIVGLMLPVGAALGVYLLS